MVRLIEFAGILVFIGFVCHFLNLLADSHQLSWFLMLVGILMAYFFGDLVSGVIHWLCDSFGDSSTPILGPLIIHPFRHHHTDPQKIVRETLIENLGASAIAGCIFLTPLWNWMSEADSPLLATIGNFYLWSIVFAVLSNLFHRWAHLSSAHKNIAINYLQKSGVIIRSAHHLRHHKAPFDRDYCILSGWANTICNRIPWRKIEHYLAKIGIVSNYIKQERLDERR